MSSTCRNAPWVRTCTGAAGPLMGIAIRERNLIWNAVLAGGRTFSTVAVQFIGIRDYAATFGTSTFEDESKLSWLVRSRQLKLLTFPSRLEPDKAMAA